MTKAPSNLQELRRRIYRKAKSETTHRFWGLFVHITKIETSRRLIESPRETAVPPASTARASGTLSPWGGLGFLRRCGKISSQAGIDPCRTAG